jgi:hypothetical protein
LKTDTLNLDDVHKMLGERDIALYRAAQEIERLVGEVQRLRMDLAEATKDKAVAS